MRNDTWLFSTLMMEPLTDQVNQIEVTVGIHIHAAGQKCSRVGQYVATYNITLLSWNSNNWWLADSASHKHVRICFCHKRLDYRCWRWIPDVLNPLGSAGALRWGGRTDTNAIATVCEILVCQLEGADAYIEYWFRPSQNRSCRTPWRRRGWRGPRLFLSSIRTRMFSTTMTSAVSFQCPKRYANWRWH